MRTDAKHRARTKSPKPNRRRRRGKVEPPKPVTPDDLLALGDLFSGLDASTLRGLASRAILVEAPRGEHLFDEELTDDRRPPVFVSTFGDVSVHATDYSGHETILNYLSVGEPFVFRAFGTENRRRMRLTAMCPVKVLRFEYDSLS